MEHEFKVIPLVIAALETTSTKVSSWSKEIDIETQITELPKTFLPCTA